MGTSILSVLPVTAMAGVRHLLVASLFLVFLGDVSGDGDGLWGRQCVSSKMCYKPWSHCARRKGLTRCDCTGDALGGNAGSGAGLEGRRRIGQVDSCGRRVQTECVGLGGDCPGFHTHPVSDSLCLLRLVLL